MSDSFVPSDPQVVRFESLSTGMQTDRPSHQLESGAGLNVARLYCDSTGLVKTRGLFPFIQTANWGRIPFLFGGERVSKIFEYTFSGGQLALAVLTDRMLYFSINLKNFNPAPWVRDYTAVSIVGTTVTISGASLTTDNVSGSMYARFDVTGVGYELRKISSITDATHFEIESALSSTLASTTFNIYAPMIASLPFVIGHAVLPSNIIICDGSLRGFYSFDGTWMSKWTFLDESSNPSNCVGAQAITYFQGRIFVGNTVESGGDVGRRRIRWSGVSNVAQFYSTDWEDFIETSGVILGFTSYEDYLIVATQDNFWMGTPYGYEATLVKPFTWRKLETGNVGAVGPRAWCTAPNGIFYMGRDDIYFMDGTKYTAQGEFIIQRTKCPVRNELIKNVESKSATTLIYDPQTECVLFGVYKTEPLQFNQLYAFSLRTNGWSWSNSFNIGLTCVQHIRTGSSTTWSTLRSDGDTWIDLRGTGRTWFDFLGGFAEAQTLVCDRNGVIYLYTASSGVDTEVLDDNSTVVHTPTLVFETGDLDFGEPDQIKTAYKFALRIQEDPGIRTTDLLFNLQGSTDRGQHWKNLGTMTFNPNEAEEELHFRLSGTNLRFRLSSTNSVAHLTLSEMTLRVRSTARQVARN